MKSNLFKFLSVFFALSIFILASCEKPDPDAQSAEDDARGSYIMADAFAVGNNEAGGGDGGKAEVPGMIVERNIMNRTVTITFENCDYRGAIRNGIIHVSYSVPDLQYPRAVSITVTFENYTMDGISVEGTIVTTYGGTFLVPAIHIVATNMIATFPNQETLNWSADQTYTMTFGFGDGDISNNVVEMSGTAEGTNREGNVFNSIYSAVTVERSCEAGYPVSGTVTIESDKGTSVIDYGEGECDKIITVTNNGITITITLD